MKILFHTTNCANMCVKRYRFIICTQLYASSVVYIF